MTPLSVVIITYNEEKNIKRCLESVCHIADEIVIVDSFSTDATEKIAATFNVKFYQRAFSGYNDQKSHAMSLSTQPMVLNLDADEVLDSAMQASILEKKQKDFPEDVYYMNRCSMYEGKWIRHGSWYPDRKLRMFRRNKAKWVGSEPHDVIGEEPGATKCHLIGDILHYSFPDFTAHINQLNKFTSVQSEVMYKKGRRASVLNLLFNPLTAFISGYFFKGGFRDGTVGLMIAVTVSYQTFAKYAKLRRLQQTRKYPGKIKHGS